MRRIVFFNIAWMKYYKGIFRREENRNYKYFEEDVPLDTAQIFNKIYPEIAESEFEKAFRDSINKDTDKKIFKAIRNSLEKVKYVPEESNTDEEQSEETKEKTSGQMSLF